MFEFIRNVQNADMSKQLTTTYVQIKMQKKRKFKSLSKGLYEEAVEVCFSGKWHRRDIQAFIGKYAGIPSYEIELMDYDERFAGVHDEVISSCADALEDTVNKILSDQSVYSIDPVLVRERLDGMTGKRREIALLCIMHQLLGHLVKLMLQPLFNVKIYPTQYASIPYKGQTALVRGIQNDLNDPGLDIRYFQKTDISKAYPSLTYAKCIEFIREEIPQAKDLLKLLQYLGDLAPGGHLIIGGYLDAWLFNFMMSYAIDHLLSLSTVRRGKEIHDVKAVHTFMDDFCIMGSSAKSVRKAVKSLEEYLEKSMNLKIKVTTGIVRLMSADQEKVVKKLPKAQSHCPYIDMGGYRITRTHVHIRDRVFLKARRQFIRAQRELDRHHSLLLHRCYKVVCYNGYCRNSNSFRIIKKYNLDKLARVAKRTISDYSKYSNVYKAEEIYELQSRINRITSKCHIGKPSRRNRQRDPHKELSRRNGRRRRCEIHL